MSKTIKQPQTINKSVKQRKIKKKKKQIIQHVEQSAADDYFDYLDSRY